MQGFTTVLPRLAIVVLVALLFAQVGFGTQARMRAPVTTLSWAFHPQSLEETYDLSDLVVLAKVTDVAPGPVLYAETTSPDHPIEVVPSLYINLSVLTPLKGVAAVGSEVKVYRPTARLPVRHATRLGRRTCYFCVTGLMPPMAVTSFCLQKATIR